MKSRRLIWSERASKDLRQVKAFIALDKPQAALRFIKKIKSKVERLKRFPFSGRTVPELFRSEIREIVIEITESSTKSWTRKSFFSLFSKDINNLSFNKFKYLNKNFQPYTKTEQKGRKRRRENPIPLLLSGTHQIFEEGYIP